jgi:hypothetical protein
MEYGIKKWEDGLELTEKENIAISKYVDFNTKNKHKMVSIPVFDLKDNNII